MPSRYCSDTTSKNSPVEVAPIWRAIASIRSSMCSVNRSVRSRWRRWPAASRVASTSWLRRSVFTRSSLVLPRGPILRPRLAIRHYDTISPPPVTPDQSLSIHPVPAGFYLYALGMLRFRAPVRHACAIASAMAALILGLGVVPASPAAATSPDCLEQIAAPDTGLGGASGMDIDPVDGLLYVVVDEAGRVDVIDQDTNTIVDSIDVPDDNGLRYLAVEHSSDSLYVADFGDDKIYVINLTTELPVTTFSATFAQKQAI